ncbi:hypothetical protein B9Z55_022759 [Caenorhabditis nigoni]|uniref:Uncharacterized protein n=1 Tax=Caenorhabditis nigoni TaxID=1611254 RepID=A0A2G5SLU1_9PELO|nr:hypothetical protein B9Z55_022759 [Caenorhabditis nigoni]
MRIHFLGLILILSVLVSSTAQSEVFLEGDLKCSREFRFHILLQEFQEEDSSHIIFRSNGTSTGNSATFSIYAKATNPGIFQVEQKLALVVIHTCPPEYDSQTDRRFIRGYGFEIAEIKKQDIVWDLDTPIWENYYNV